MLDSIGRPVDIHLHNISLFKSTSFLNGLWVFLTIFPVPADRIARTIRIPFIFLSGIINDPDHNASVRSSKNSKFEFVGLVGEDGHVEDVMCEILAPGSGFVDVLDF